MKEGVEQSRATLDLKHFGALNNGDFIVLLQEEDITSGNSSLWKYIQEKDVFEHLIDVPTQGTDINYFTERSDGKLWLWGKGKGHYLVNLSTSEIDFFLMSLFYRVSYQLTKKAISGIRLTQVR